MTPISVVLVGAAGQTGGSIANALLDSPSEFTLKVIIRPSSLKKRNNVALIERGVGVIESDLTESIDELAEKLKGNDVLISAVGATQQDDQIPLATAAKKAGIKRFLPCGYLTIIPPGIHVLRDGKEKVYNHIKQIHLPYTIIDVGWWFQLSFPRVPSGRLDYAHSGFFHEIIGDGNAPNAVTDLNVIGQYVAKIIMDERTLNKYILAYDTIVTQNQAWALTEKLSGEKIDRKYLSSDDLLKQMRSAEASFKGIVKEDLSSVFAIAPFQYLYSWGVRHDNTPEYAKYLGYLTTKELYPGFQPGNFEQFLQDQIDGKGKKPYEDHINEMAAKAQA